MHTRCDHKTKFTVYPVVESLSNLCLCLSSVALMVLSKLQKLLGYAVSDAKLQKVVNAVQSLSSLQPDNHESKSLLERQVNGNDDGQEFGANLVFHHPARFLVDASFDDREMWGVGTNVTSTSLHGGWYDHSENTNKVFDLEWLRNECSRIVSGSASQLPQDKLAMAICRVLKSDKAGDEIAGDLLDLVGDSAFQTVQDLITVMDYELLGFPGTSASTCTKYQSIIYVLKGS
ncbi:hypothetical protein HanXRQr2_Chr11g0481381 [Helianthus annuus]|uniref:Uncharacterized protein n=1 Tax=Helianthus annuus TaxID=4232 RepID=A0A251T9H0_HELAN|nr:hypothetical protein HanXRQr2_Chr11g0481381 [Helianthus annuus]KAJ0508533.1 hypothetical protein HanIR_Chr11g0518281 [Helianthus annuus]KAJ0516782.1 hypothetical protein HanHA89_Chr11g0417641 [Helianthus annuus]KAJ0684787.1 hypothetical protein HanLR1_Chr11g0395071 [Helianthus annuus]